MNEPKTCPSRSCEEGVHLLGVMTASGRLAYVSSPIRIGASFVDRVAEARPEQRFRFSGPCVESSCPNWTGDSCAVAEVVIAEAQRGRPVTSRLPQCTIRRTCRWFAQHGGDACSVCPSVVADIGGTRTLRSGPPGPQATAVD